ncbi:MAG: deoxyribodipyrimidine photo-lyase [Terracidiphilus sp.]|nr:deoxyribodipyrimidine photo-lyase [Terracidiphilus sp.]
MAADLEHLAANPRVTVRRGGVPRLPAKCVVYWMQRAMRAADNPALDVAIEAGNLLGLPVVIYFLVIPNYPNANLRHYHFMQQGLRDVEADAAERGVGFVVRRKMPDGAGASLEAFLEESKAAMVVGDENPCREPERWRNVLAKRLKIPFWTVDADVVVPSRVFNRSFVLLHHFRPHLKRALPEFLVEPEKMDPEKRWEPGRPLESYELDKDITDGFTKLDRRVGPVDGFTGGRRAGMRLLDEFVRTKLAGYEEKRNHPEADGTSRLSPYLHFGNLSPVRIGLAVQRAVAVEESAVSNPTHLRKEREKGWGTAVASGTVATSGAETLKEPAEKFLEQVIGWRELAVLFVRHEVNYDSWECAAPWARKTLIEHAGDARQRYSKETMERAETGDELWNAAQRQMVRTGWMHNYMRMYWAKKILEWAPDPEKAFAWAVEWNDRYELDGRDPNGYAGIAWAIVGRHDRPWFNKPVFGLVRPMSGASLRKKFDSERYIRQQEEGRAEGGSNREDAG